ncbi:efflux RND transporter periplasmic adaptor subunit [Legionella brunensis]|uniref:Chemiosmotic efflux system protein B-like protein n=1 Tax=Legionella brunensis TaxID=29422 RepID=A0A0W0S4Z0_9GAMM|nr:efflux RND transporter periplasmic adaptor subunit [Legionella brunensis]KTC78137.1 chemiosmotic efflux system protein B-like protein [Legionella brunensis]
MHPFIMKFVKSTQHALGRLTFLITACYSIAIFAHGEKIEISEEPHGPVVLTKEQEEIIDLKLAKVSQQPLSQILGLNGEIQLLPNEQADVSVRISGNVSALYANLGDHIKIGQPLVKVQSRLIGDPPPSVVINSPMSGIIDARNVTLGQAVEPNTVLFHISNRRRLIAVAKVYEEDLGKVKIGQKAYLHVLSYPKQTFLGKVILIEPNLDSITRTVNVQIILDNSQDLLKPGMFTRANLILQENEDALTIPNAAILEANDEKFVFRREGKQFQRVIIKTGISDEINTEIIEGLAAGDEVVIQGNRQLYTLWLTGGQLPTTEDHQ